MDIKSFLLGSEAEKKALGALSGLKGKNQLSWDETAQKDGAETTVLKLRGRQGLMLLTAAGLAWGFTQIEEPHPNAEPAVVHAPEQKEALTFQAGPFAFVQDPAIPEAEFRRIQNVLTRAYPVLERYIPTAELRGKQIIVRRSSEKVSKAGYKPGSFEVTADVSDGLLIHEFTHLLHGDNDLYFDLVEEGLAAAFSISVPRELGLESWDNTLSLQMNNNMKENLFLKPGASYTASPALHGTKLESAGYFWLDLEKKNPGFIRRFHEAYFAFLKDGGKKEDLLKPEVFEKVLEEAGLLADFQAAAQTNLIAHPSQGRAEEQGKSKLLIAYRHFSKGGKRQLFIAVAKKTATGEPEGVWKQLEVRFKLINVSTGKTSELLGSKARGDGEVKIDLEDSKDGKKMLETLVGVGTRYKIIVDTQVPEGPLHEEFEFDYL